LSEPQAAGVRIRAAGEAPARRAAWDWNEVLTPRVVLLALPVAGLLIWAYAYPLMRWEAMWRSSSAWNHGYLIPVIAALIAHFRLTELKPRRIAPSLWGLVPILGGLTLRVWSQVLKYAYPADVTFLLVVGGTVLLLLGWDMLRALWIPVLYLGLMIPWDIKYYEQVALPLQTLSASMTDRFLALVGYDRVEPELLKQWLAVHGPMDKFVSRDVNVLHLSSGPLTVAEACSGLHLLFAFVALGVLMAYMTPQPVWERLLIMGSSVPIAVFCNFVRVTLMAVSSDQLHFERLAVTAGAPTWSAHVPQFLWNLFKGGDLPSRLEALRQTVLNPESPLHQSFGFAMLGLAFALMWAELRVIDLFFIEDEQSQGVSHAAKAAGGGTVAGSV